MSEYRQLALIENQVPNQKLVNVASVAQRSPFRYPGGKTWLVPDVKAWLRNRRRPTTFVEIFAGGGIVGLTVAFDRLADRIVLIELDPEVASVWHTMLSDENEWLAKRILQFQMSPEAVASSLERKSNSLRDLAFATILRNRINHGGILAAGSGVLKYGENGRGLSSRWYPETLARRIRAIGQIRENIEFIQGDGLEYMREFSADQGSTFFIDPPYTAGGKKAGKRLYTYSVVDHERLFELSSTLRGDFLMTYDEAPEIRAFASNFGFAVDEVEMKNKHHTRMHELLVSKVAGPAGRPA
jgi:DNA adenine methylase